jgi:hypothetical protein
VHIGIDLLLLLLLQLDETLHSGQLKLCCTNQNLSNSVSKIQNLLGPLPYQTLDSSHCLN